MEVFDLFSESLDLGFELLSLKTRKTAESHIYDMLSLLVSKAETLAHTHLGLSLGT